MAEVTVTNDNFESEVLESGIPVLVDFWAPWCGPCKMLGPVVSQLAQEYDGKLKVCKCNVDDFPELAGRYGVSSIPALKFFKGGQIAGESVGFKPLPALKQLVDGIIG